MTQTSILKDITMRCCNELMVMKKNGDPLPEPEEAETKLVTECANEINIINAMKQKGEAKIKAPTKLEPAQVASLMCIYFRIIRLKSPTGETKHDLLLMYNEKEGIYTNDDDYFKKAASRFIYPLTKNDFKEIVFTLQGITPRKTRNEDANLIPVGNGIFNYETKTLLPFTPELIFLSKSNVNYNENAKLVKIHDPTDNTEWDIESWMNSLSDDPEIVNLLWEILGAIIRPNTRWNKSAWFYSETGNNGKGTLCELMRNLCGDAYCSIPINNFNKDFMLEPLTRSSAIITDENDVGTFIDKAANLKACITNDVLYINRKYENPISYQFRGFMVQCLNEFPKTKDKSDSFYRRQLFVPFEKCFTGVEKRQIKDDYLHRPEVLEYVLKKVLNMNYDKLSEPKSCSLVLTEYKEYNDPLRAFWDEFRTDFVWDLLPFTFLYDLYKEWYKRYNPEGKPQGRIKFINEILNITKNDDIWYCKNKSVKIKTGNRMNDPEPLIIEYDLTDWKNKNAARSVRTKISEALFDKKESYRGLLRKGSEENE